MKALWRTEEFGCKYNANCQRSVEDGKAVDFLKETTQKVNGRYEVGLLWKDNDMPLTNNRHVAEHRLKLLEKRLQRDPILSSSYKQTNEKDLENGYIQKLTAAVLALPIRRQWVLPHHPVLNPKKPGKVRRVCDAASKFQGQSLNDHLITGPDLLNSLIGVFMCFR